MQRKILVVIGLFSMINIFLGFLDRTIFAENIDPYNDGYQYAYGETVGLLNAEPLGDSGPGVEVEDYKLAGYIWAENVGWLSLSCENTSSCITIEYGVTNDGKGTLSGYAWGENVGWINFDPLSGGVTIDDDGKFNGLAWGENIGWITFRSTGLVPFGVTTSWVASVNDCEGDFDGDDDVDGLDLALFVADFRRTDCNQADPCNGDFSGDGNVNGSDLAVFAADFGRTNCP